MTTTTTRSVRRGGVLLLAASLPVMPLLAAAPAHAEVPEGWSDPEPVSLLHALGLVLGLPLLLFVLITLAVLLPALARGERLLPSTAPDDQWFGGPGKPAEALESGQRPRELGPTGGASGTW